MKSSYLKTISYTFSAAALLLCSSQNYAQQYYKWVDAHGSTHYTTTPPPKGAKRLDKVSTYGNSHQTTSNTTQQAHQGTADTSSNTTQPSLQPAAPAPVNTTKPQSPPPASATSAK